MSPKTAHTSTLQTFIHIFKMHNFNSNNGGGERARIQEWACTVIHAYIHAPLVPMAPMHLDANFRTRPWFIKVLKARNRTHNHFESPSRPLIFIISHLTPSSLLAQFSAETRTMLRHTTFWKVLQLNLSWFSHIEVLYPWFQPSQRWTE